MRRRRKRERGGKQRGGRDGEEQGEREGRKRQEEGGEEVYGEGGNSVDGQAWLPCHVVDGQAVAIKVRRPLHQHCHQH